MLYLIISLFTGCSLSPTNVSPWIPLTPLPGSPENTTCWYLTDYIGSTICYSTPPQCECDGSAGE